MRIAIAHCKIQHQNLPSPPDEARQNAWALGLQRYDNDYFSARNESADCDVCTVLYERMKQTAILQSIICNVLCSSMDIVKENR